MNQQIKHISFNEKLHKYTDEYNQVYTPVTSHIDLYKDKFDEQYWSLIKAKELNLTQKEVLDNWAKIRNDACDKGNTIHKRLENSIDDSSLKIKIKNTIHNNDCSQLEGYEVSLEELRKTPLALHYPKILKLLEFYFNKDYKAYAEKRFYLSDYLIAGTIDLVLIKGKNFVIIDWKTNKDDLHFTSGYYKKVNGIKTNIWVNKKSYYKYPLHKLEDCKGIGYTLQLSSYAWMMEQWGFTCIGLILCHIRETINEVNIQKEKRVDIVQIEYRNKDIEKMFNETKKNRLNKGDKGKMKFSSKFTW